MVGLTGLEKFSHLEDKIYRTIELTKTLRQEKEALEREIATEQLAIADPLTGLSKRIDGVSGVSFAALEEPAAVEAALTATKGSANAR